jgi:hypothetical protein
MYMSQLSRLLRGCTMGLIILATSAGCDSSKNSSTNNPLGGAGTDGYAGTGNDAAGTGVNGGSGIGPDMSVGGTGASGVGGGGSGGSGGAGGTDGGPTMPNTLPGFMNLAPAMGAPLDEMGTALTPPAPDGWVWHEIEGAKCRDGSKTGLFVHKGDVNKLLIFLEGGGACSNNHFCAFNPTSSASSLTGTGQTVIGSAFGVVADRQQPGVYVDSGHKAAGAGIHDLNNPDNPFKGWSQVYIPYCTGDVFFGTRDGATVPGDTMTQQHFVGYLNMKLFMSRLVPTFKAKVDQVVLAGSSAGSFGAALNYSMVQDSFGEVRVDLIMDSGLPFTDKHMPVCMQKRWREQWGMNPALPPDCTECQQADGGGFLGLADFVLRKHPNARLAAFSGTQDEVMRLFFSAGLNDCANYDTADPVAVVLGQFDPKTYYPAQEYTDAMNEVKMKYLATNKLSTYMINVMNATCAPNFHEHIFRPEFYSKDAGTITEAQFVKEWLGGKVQQIGP